MMTFDDAKELALGFMPEADMCTEFDDAFVFSVSSSMLDSIVVKKDSRTVTSYFSWFLESDCVGSERRAISLR